MRVDFWRPVPVIARLTWLEALRGRLAWLVAAALALALVLVEFAGAIAVTEGAVIRAAFLGSLLRGLAVFILCLFVAGSMAREFADKTVELMLSLPLPRTSYYLGKLMGYLAVAARRDLGRLALVRARHRLRREPPVRADPLADHRRRQRRRGLLSAFARHRCPATDEPRAAGGSTQPRQRGHGPRHRRAGLPAAGAAPFHVQRMARLSGREHGGAGADPGADGDLQPVIVCRRAIRSAPPQLLAAC